ncbi:MAG: TIGR00341 family protein, partial [Geobacteraceae bacterium GWB2_52_12]
MNSTYLRFHIKKLKDFLAVKTEMVNHRAVIKEVASSVDRSWVYYSILLLASLIALLGLLTNSVAVVIGAMLISPLMGPIISSGLAFTIGDLHLARRAFKTIAVSVTLTIVVCTIISFISPLKEPTAEILARVRPNIFDLFVAVLSGIVGAIALCTKRDYLITASGVAIATAVIPPLSVIGYGLGTGQLMLALGGFLLFFTNFVAIVLTSDLVFFILGFRTSHLETVQYSPRKRFLIITSLLTLISIPLVYTLVVDITMVKEKKRIERVLKQHLNKDLVSRMTGYDY